MKSTNTKLILNFRFIQLLKTVLEKKLFRGTVSALISLLNNKFKLDLINHKDIIKSVKVEQKKASEKISNGVCFSN